MNIDHDGYLIFFMKNLSKTHIVPQNIKGFRLDRYAYKTFDSLPSNKSAYKAIKRGEILIDGKSCQPNSTIEPGQCIEYRKTEKKRPKPFHLPLNIIFEDDHLSVVEKVPGFAVNGNRYRTIENALLYNLKESSQPDALNCPKPVHRLDSAAGGLLIAAKTSSAEVDLNRQFQNRVIKKRYRAIVIGNLQGKDSIKEPVDGRPSETIYEAVKNVTSLKNGHITLIDLWPITGRTHQLRRHLSHIGFPILGDKIYGDEGNTLRSKGLFLWAVEISFNHPADKSPVNFIITEPEKFSTILRREERRWRKYH